MATENGDNDVTDVYYHDDEDDDLVVKDPVLYSGPRPLPRVRVYVSASSSTVRVHVSASAPPRPRRPPRHLSPVATVKRKHGKHSRRRNCLGPPDGTSGTTTGMLYPLPVRTKRNSVRSAVSAPPLRILKVSASVMAPAPAPATPRKL